MSKFDPWLIVEYAPHLALGAWRTIYIVVAAFLLGYAFGIVLALLSFLPGRLPRTLLTIYSVCLRSIPFIIALFIIYYGLPFFGVRLPTIYVAIVSLAVYKSAYYAEAIRGAIVALPRGQFESARAVGMSPAQAFRHVIAPQILRGLIPPSTNLTLMLIKESSVLSSIAVAELTYQGLIMQGNTYAALEVFTAVSAVYWALCSMTAWLAHRLEARSNAPQAAAIQRNRIAARYLSFERVGK
ncbi:amino acid ABC transporter permease [Boseaceae bacterium BT-24-1]|nr:amino acid ABC transporter permease [Boseaceae bacterium BT-24-1]